MARNSKRNKEGGSGFVPPIELQVGRAIRLFREWAAREYSPDLPIVLPHSSSASVNFYPFQNNGGKSRLQILPEAWVVSQGERTDVTLPYTIEATIAGKHYSLEPTPVYGVKRGVETRVVFQLLEVSRRTGGPFRRPLSIPLETNRQDLHDAVFTIVPKST